ncbi:hypothetical protein [Streptomyces sp. MUM 203J]|nr:hypothetical protein [Streptomyces sp. MUM 203J]
MLDSTDATPTDVAKRIADALSPPGGGVDNHTKHDDPTVNS